MANDLTPRQEQQMRVQQQGKQLVQYLASDAMKKRIAGAIPKHMTADRVIRMALTAASKSPKLLECSMESVGLALLQASQFGLEINGRDAHLVPFKGVCQLIVDYKGYVQLAYRSGVVKSIKAHAVHARDDFDYSEGTDEHLHYKAFDGGPSGTEDPGPLTHAWAMCKLINGGEAWIVLNKRQILERRAKSQNPGNWDKFPESYWAKTAVRELAKWMPQMAELSAFNKVVEGDDDSIDVTVTDNDYAKAGALEAMLTENSQPLTEEEKEIPFQPPTAEEETAARKQLEREEMEAAARKAAASKKSTTATPTGETTVTNPASQSVSPAPAETATKAPYAASDEEILDGWKFTLEAVESASECGRLRREELPKLPKHLQIKVRGMIRDRQEQLEG